MSDVRLIDANALMERMQRKKSGVADKRYTEGFNDAVARFRSMVHSSPTVDAVPRDEYEALLKRFWHLLESDYIRSFDEVDRRTGTYKRDIKEADEDNWGKRGRKQ